MFEALICTGSFKTRNEEMGNEEMRNEMEMVVTLAEIAMLSVKISQEIICLASQWTLSKIGMRFILVVNIALRRMYDRVDFQNNNAVSIDTDWRCQ